MTDLDLTAPLDAFCRRLVEGNEFSPSGADWDALDRLGQNFLREQYVGPLHAALGPILEALAEREKQAKAKAWDEGYTAGGDDLPECTVPCGACMDCLYGGITLNPYRGAL